jgi:hypothetical protein
MTRRYSTLHGIFSAHEPTGLRAHTTPTQRPDPKPKKCNRAYLGDILLRAGHHVIVVVGDRDLVRGIYVVAARPQPVRPTTPYRQLVMKLMQKTHSTVHMNITDRNIRVIYQMFRCCGSDVFEQHTNTVQHSPSQCEFAQANRKRTKYNPHSGHTTASTTAHSLATHQSTHAHNPRTESHFSSPREGGVLDVGFST